MKLTAGQVANHVGKTSYTIKRWYKWYEELTDEQREQYKKEGMPELPKYDIVGKRKDRVWDFDDIKALKKFSEWVPKGKIGKMGGV